MSKLWFAGGFRAGLFLPVPTRTLTNIIIILKDARLAFVRRRPLVGLPIDDFVRVRVLREDG